MRYTIRRISIRSALKIGLLLGWLLALLPALAIAWLAMIALQGASGLLSQVQTYEISVLGQSIATLDFLELLGLADLAGRIDGLAALGWGLFATLTAGLTVLGGAMVAITAVLFSLGYNLLAALAAGLIVELEPRSSGERSG